MTIDTSKSSIFNMDALELINLLPNDSVDCILTSPPYWGLRKYGSQAEIGREDTPEEYILRLGNIFNKCDRILKKKGTMWINMGDVYRDKNLLQLPFRLAAYLQDHGWILRNDVIWNKPNPMPIAVKDRMTNAYEHIFFFVKSQFYFYDQDAIRVPVKRDTPRAEYDYQRMLKGRVEFNKGKRPNDGKQMSRSFVGGDPIKEANRRDVWTVTTGSPKKKVHFATFPPDLIRPCIKAGCPKDGLILDMFAGTGTTLKVAMEEQRHCIACELHEEYLNPSFFDQ